jgi:tRNA threonylcarbamoyladenosine biosynthesis protein TsaB
VHFILSIDTAVAGASVCLSHAATVLGLKRHEAQNESAAWIHTAIQELLQEHSLTVSQLAAIAVSAGPGSYTGLRIGMATAKGLCYAAGLPLIAINTLQMMAAAATGQHTGLLCPMIDARRMEVFTAMYTKDLEEVLPAQALILSETSFAEVLNTGPVLFFGNGSDKFRPLVQHPHAIFKTIAADASHIATLANNALLQKKFVNLAYCEPFYGKDFFSPGVKQ